MIFNLRINNKNINDIEIYTRDNIINIISSINLFIFSNFLLDNLNKKDEIIYDFDDLDNIAGHIFNKYDVKNEGNNYKNIITEIKNKLKIVADKYNLYLSED